MTLTRYQEFKGPHELDETPSASDYWFEFRHPDTGAVVRWESDRDLATLALMMDGNVPNLLVTPQFGSSMIRFRCPNPPYLLYRLDQRGAWISVPVQQIPVKRLRVNMTFSPDDQRERIVASDFVLSAEHTSNAKRNSRPYLINFTHMSDQTFLKSSCGYPPNELIDK